MIFKHEINTPITFGIVSSHVPHHSLQEKNGQSKETLIKSEYGKTGG
jgi:hypothetical protein